jgi:hypothetical protein
VNVSKHQRWPLLPHDQARLEYGRLLWKRPAAKARLLQHWNDERHPYARRFSQVYRPWVEKVLETSSEADDALDKELSQHGLSLRVVVREIPPVFGSFY